MACKTKTLRATLCAFSDGTQTALYHSVFRVPVADWAKARLSFFVEGNSGLETVSGAGAYGDKEADFDAPTVIDFPSGASQSLNGDRSVYGSSYGKRIWHKLMQGWTPIGKVRIVVTDFHVCQWGGSMCTYIDRQAPRRSTSRARMSGIGTWLHGRRGESVEPSRSLAPSSTSCGTWCGSGGSTTRLRTTTARSQCCWRICSGGQSTSAALAC